MTRSRHSNSHRGARRAFAAAAGRRRVGAGAAFLRRLPRQSVQPRRAAVATAPERAAQAPQRAAQADPGDLSVRLDRLESALRQLTGTIEQLQYRNQQLEMQLKRMQDDTEYRFQQLGSKGAPPRRAPRRWRRRRRSPPPVPPRPAAAPTCSIRRSIRMRPARRARSATKRRSPPPSRIADNEPPVGAPGGRAAGAPLDLSTLAGNAPAQPAAPMAERRRRSAPSQLPPPPPRNADAPPARSLPTLPPSAIAAGRIRPRLRLCAAQGLCAGRSRPSATS